ncbi:MAG: hypothetical protein V2I27_00520 [Erythrobacter sp.]|jgi:hypothetical protein|nr:hypothetical protein [Erythrobacter sp.]
MSEDLPAGPRAGERHTTFFDDPLKDHLLRALVTVSMELSVTRERVATLEALLIEAGVIEEAAANIHAPAGEDAAKRAEQRQKLIESVLGPLVESLAAQD